MTCFYCGKQHDFKCDLISAYEFWPENGGIRRIEFITFVDTEGLQVTAVAELPPGTSLN